MDDFVQYHNSEAMGISCLELSNNDDNYFNISTSKYIPKIIGNRVWLIGGRGKPREYYLCFYFFADTIEPSDGDEYFKYLVNGQRGKYFRPAIFLNGFPWFKDFLKNQQNFSLGLRKIEKVFVNELEKVVSYQEVQEISIDEIQSQKIGGGFGNSDINRKVEQAAVKCVKDDYIKRGWSVESVESKKCGFDLLCIKAEKQELVEVKGVQGNLVSFFITINELNQSRAKENFVLCVVTSALSNPMLQKFTAKSFNKQFNLEPILYRASIITK